MTNSKTLMQAGMLFLVVALTWPRFLPFTGGLGANWVDGIRGLFFGISISMNLISVRLTARQRRGAGS